MQHCSVIYEIESILYYLHWLTAHSMYLLVLSQLLILLLLALLLLLLLRWP
jgi:hypothetical protein